MQNYLNFKRSDTHNETDFENNSNTTFNALEINENQTEKTQHIFL